MTPAEIKAVVDVLAVALDAVTEWTDMPPPASNTWPDGVIGMRVVRGAAKNWSFFVAIAQFADDLRHGEGTAVGLWRSQQLIVRLTPRSIQIVEEKLYGKAAN